MTELKAGDKVLVDEHARRDSAIHTRAGAQVRGKVVYVSNPKPDWSGSITVDFEGGTDGWFVNPEDVTLVEAAPETPDMVNKPAHYSAGMPEGIEVIDIIRSQGWEDNYNLGNATKYLLRCEHKGTKKQDLEKLLVYVQWELNRL